jgi:hypothetical protein
MPNDGNLSVDDAPSADLRAESLMSEKDVAARLGLSAVTVESWRRKGCGPYWFRINGRTVRYPLFDFEQWLIAQEFSPRAASRGGVQVGDELVVMVREV